MFRRALLVAVSMGVATLAGVAALTGGKPASALAQDPLEGVTAVLDKYIDAGELAGAVSLVYHRGEVQVSARGVQDLETGTPMARDTIFGLASMTKPITAVAVMMLVEEGKLDLDAPVDPWLPELAEPKVLSDPNGPLDQVYDAPRAVTPRDLLRYTMGLGFPEWAGIASEAPIAQEFAAMRRGDFTADEYMERLGALPLAFAPGERWVYHTPSMVAGVLIERASGMGLAEFFRTRIFEPLGMPDTGFWVPAAKRHRLASYYRGGEQPGTLVPVADNGTRYAAPPKFPSAGGGLVSTVDDYLRFGRMLLGRGELDGVRILSAASVDEMLTDQLPEEPERRFFLFEDFWRGAGFGLGLQITTEQSEGGPSVGSFWWHGATGVQWTADPQQDLIFLRFIQRGDVPRGFGAEYMQALYSAIRP
ncbi:MAG: beta-lactamase family protein [Acidobacteria bacterium]|nr:beta-lactamase family protein [Acidobacteriota bacterium]